MFPAQFYLTVNAEHEQHGEEENCPQRGDGQLCHCFWVRQKRQSRAWGDKQDTKHQWGGPGLGFPAPAVVWGWCGRLWMQHPGRDFSCSVFAGHGGTARTWFLKQTIQKAKKTPQKLPNPTNQNSVCSSAAAPERPLGTAKAGTLSLARVTCSGAAQLPLPSSSYWQLPSSAWHRSEQKQRQLRDGEDPFQHSQHSHLLFHSIHSLKVRILINSEVVDSQTLFLLPNC